MTDSRAVATIESAHDDPLVRVRNVNKVFRQRGGPVQALQHVDLDIRRGEFVSLLGPSGCGKSTLLRIIGGLHDATSGEVTINGLDANAARAAKQYGLVPQSPALVPWKTLDQNVRFLHAIGDFQPIVHERAQHYLGINEIFSATEGDQAHANG